MGIFCGKDHLPASKMSTMITYPHRYEARIGRVVLDAYDVIATIAEACDDYSNWTVSKIEAEGMIEFIDGYGIKDWRPEWVTIPADSPLYTLIIRDLYDNCKSDIDEAWRLAQMEKAPA